jgi:predicted ABC-type ATPase
MRMFAGPNGSGKSTLKSVLDAALLGVYLNPDEMESEINARSSLNLAALQVETTPEEVQKYFERSTLFAKTELAGSNFPEFKDGQINFARPQPSGYLAAAVIEFIRDKLIEQRVSFTFETVMSHPGKIELMNKARQKRLPQLFVFHCD